MTLIHKWATDATWTSGPKSGTATQLALTQGEIEQGVVAGLSVKADHFNWLIANLMQTFDDLTFGRGTDGDVVIASGTTTLTRDMYYESLDVQSGATLKTANFRVFVRGALTIGGTIDADPDVAAGSLIGGHPTVAGQTASAAGAAGVGTRALGGNGAAGGTGNGGANAGGAGGTAALPPLQRIPEVLLGRILDSTGMLALYGGASGGAGGGSGTGTSGTGGAGGGLLMLVARDIVWAGGTCTAIGDTGGDATGGGNNGGGGGGGGGTIIQIAHFHTGSSAFNVNGGVGGAATGTGTVGADASAGTTHVLTI